MVTFKLATATPSVISISGIAICPISSNVEVKKCGVWYPVTKKNKPRNVADIRGSFLSVLNNDIFPETNQIPIEKDKIDVIDRTKTA